VSETTFLTRDDLENVPQEMLPIPVFSDNLRSFFSWGIKVHERGNYNHFMWMVHPGQLASQNTLFQLQSVKDYVDTCRLKLWYCKRWTPEQRYSVIKTIEAELGKPWYRRLYDVPAIAGQLFWHEIQTPGFSICSDYGAMLKLVDGKEYDLRYPDPEQVNRWLGKYPDRYEVYGRYLPD
jgi:hypothetical protein